VIRDWRRPSYKQDWIAVRDFVNKYDLAAQYPDLAAQILAVDPRDTLPWWELVMRQDDGSVDTDDIPIYHFYHKNTPSLQGGKYVLLVNDQLVLHQGPLPYLSPPVVRCAPSEFHGSCFGYSQLWELQSLQCVLDQLISAAATNYDAFGVQVIASPKGSEFSKDTFGKGMALLEFPPGMPAPQGVNLTAMPEGWLEYAKFIISLMETQSGVNAVARGKPQDALGSGAPASAMALLQNQFIQYNSGTVRAAIKALSELGMGILSTLSLQANDIPRAVMVAGKDKVARLTEVTGAQVERIGRVVVDIDKGQSRTMAWRFSLIETLIKFAEHTKEPVFDGPHSILEILKSGNLDTAYEHMRAEIMLVKRENAALSRGEPVQILAIDNHAMHMKEHGCLLADPEIRKDPARSQVVLMHIMEHTKFQVTATKAQEAAAAGAAGGPEGGPGGPEKPSGPSGGRPPGPPGEPPAEGPEPGMPGLPKDPTTGEPPAM
jgi:hypothetical protein